MNPTLAARSRRQRLQALAQHLPATAAHHPDSDPPLALLPYLAQPAEPPLTPPLAEQAGAEPRPERKPVSKPERAWAELLTWLLVLLVDALLALRDLRLGERLATQVGGLIQPAAEPQPGRRGQPGIGLRLGTAG